ncbi:MAG: stage 0 sporulation family protein [Clostridia bacterium]|nr:stage 0 sporulation family protein [Clostridia bacterium]
MCTENENTPVQPAADVEIIGVKFKPSGKIYYFASNNNIATADDQVIVETARGLEIGMVATPNKLVKESEIVPPLRPVIRIATPADIKHAEENKTKEAEAFEICKTKIAEHKLDMSLVEAEYTFDNSKLLFYFTSDGRVDFRDLVKDLASIFRTRIELRQIGIRDEAKLLGGLGVCGRAFCCSSFLSDFVQVSIKMAKEQNFSLNSAKISGACGRLMCCLRYEHETYDEAIKNTPPLGSVVKTPSGNGIVIETNPLAELIKVRLDDKPETPKAFSVNDVTVLRLKNQKTAEEDAE